MSDLITGKLMIDTVINLVKYLTHGVWFNCRLITDLSQHQLSKISKHIVSALVTVQLAIEPKMN